MDRVRTNKVLAAVALALAIVVWAIILFSSEDRSSFLDRLIDQELL